jgi:hypothetical protein
VQAGLPVNSHAAQVFGLATRAAAAQELQVNAKSSVRYALAARAHTCTQHLLVTVLCDSCQFCPCIVRPACDETSHVGYMTTSHARAYIYRSMSPTPVDGLYSLNPASATGVELYASLQCNAMYVYTRVCTYVLRYVCMYIRMCVSSVMLCGFQRYGSL